MLYVRLFLKLNNTFKMGLPDVEKKYYTVEEYFQLEVSSDIRHEFYKNECFPIMGTTRKHNDIVQNIAAQLRPVFRAKGCGVYTESVKVEVIKDVYYPYPDVILTCDESDVENTIIKMPMLIIEVLSPTTQSHDKDFKWQKYRKVPSLCYYMMVSQAEISVEVYTRVGNSMIWSFQEYTDLEQNISFLELDFELSLSAIYEMIQFD